METRCSWCWDGPNPLGNEMCSCGREHRGLMIFSTVNAGRALQLPSGGFSRAPEGQEVGVPEDLGGEAGDRACTQKAVVPGCELWCGPSLPHIPRGA